MTDASVVNAYTQLFSVGLVWISLHCVGMCGTLVIGLDVAGVQKGLSPTSGSLRILTYQAGRALIYLMFGGMAGLLGATLKNLIAATGGAMSVVFGALVLFTTLPRLVRRPAPSSTVIKLGVKKSFFDQVADRLRLLLLPLSQDPSPSSAFMLGATMGFLPCMITFWALGLAALTGSVLHGALVMLALVVMTTPMLLGASLLPRVFAQRLGRFAQTLPRLLLAMSGLWLILVGLAGLDVISHAHLGFDLLGRHYLVMFW